MIGITTEEYNDSSIESYEHVAAVRERPTMYIEELGQRGVFRLGVEGFGNVIDEYFAGRATTMWVSIDENDSRITVRDDGAGIPLGKAVECATKTHTGGKFKSKSYKIKIGQNGVGLTAINALSIFLSIEIHRDKKKLYVEFSQGNIVKGPIVTDEPNQKVTGTTISFVPDKGIFGDIGVKSSVYQDYLNKIAHINAGLKIEYSGKTKSGKDIKETYFSKNGISDYLKNELLKGHRPVISTPIDIPLTSDTVRVSLGTQVDPITKIEADIFDNRVMGIQVSFNWCEDLREANIMSFVNGVQTINDGYHVQGFRNGIADVIRNDLRDGSFISKKDPLYEYVSRDDYFEGMVVALVAMHEKPLFDGQTKNKFSSSDYEPFARSVVAAKFKEWTLLNPAKYKLVISQILLSAKARQAASKARNLIKGAAPVSSSALSQIEKYSECRSKDPKIRELFIVEGDSAGGSAKAGGDMHYQAIYKTTGKPSNVYGTNVFENLMKPDSKSEIKELIMIFGCGWGKSFDITKLRFNKIIIMTDADPDGGHISSLLIGFIYRYMPELIIQGKVFIANPPLYEFAFKKKCMYIANMNDYYNILESTIRSEFELCSYSKTAIKEIKNKNFYRIFLKKIRGYSSLISSLATQTNINPQLLEDIMIYYDDIISHKRVSIRGHQLDVWFNEATGAYVVEGIYDTVYHRIELNSFISQLCRDAIKQIKDLKWSNLVLRHRKTKKLLGPGLYKMSSGMEYLINHNAQLTRFKGLGEMNPKKLWETTMNPETRILTQVTMDPALSKQYDDWLDILIGSNIDGRKEYYRQYL